MYSSSVEDQLIDGLSFKLAPGSSYVTERKSVTYFPQGSNVVKATLAREKAHFRGQICQ